MKTKSFHIANVIRKEHADKFVKAIDDQTFMRFEVVVAPNNGEWSVSVQTSYKASRKTIQEMLTYLMFLCICD
jgi:hypothetical protein